MAIRYYKRVGPFNTYLKAISDKRVLPEEFYPGNDLAQHVATHKVHPAGTVSVEHGYLEETIPSRDPSELKFNEKLEPGEQQKLFNQIPTTVNLMFVDRDIQHAATHKLYGLTGKIAKDVGHGISYSHDLSPHSARLAKFGMDIGLLIPNPKNPEAVETNTIAVEGANTYRELYTEGDDLHITGYSEVSPKEMLEATRIGREFAKKSLEQKRLSSQFDKVKPTNDNQLQLPGEW